MISNVSLQASPDKVENKQKNPSLKRYFGQTTFITCLVITVEIFLFYFILSFFTSLFFNLYNDTFLRLGKFQFKL